MHGAYVLSIFAIQKHMSVIYAFHSHRMRFVMRCNQWCRKQEPGAPKDLFHSHQQHLCATRKFLSSSVVRTKFIWLTCSFMIETIYITQPIYILLFCCNFPTFSLRNLNRLFYALMHCQANKCHMFPIDPNITYVLPPINFLFLLLLHFCQYSKTAEREALKIGLPYT